MNVTSIHLIARKDWREKATSLFWISIFIVIFFSIGSAKPQSTIPEQLILELHPGVQGGIPTVDVVMDLKDLLASPDSDCATIIQDAIDQLETPGAILLPEGEFTLTSPLTLKSGVVLRGKGMKKTRLLFNLPDTKQGEGAIVMAGELATPLYTIEGDIAENDTTINVTSAKELSQGQHIVLYRDNDAEVMYTKQLWNQTWANDSVGQLFQIQTIQENELSLDVPLRLSYLAALHPRVKVIHPIGKVGVENLYVERVDDSFNVIFKISLAENCWIKNVESAYCHRMHVQSYRSRFITIRDCYFHHAHSYEGGGRGYGVLLSDQTSDCLVTNNVFRKLRHAMMVKEGANGNVFSYNFSIETTLSAISIHGHYSYMNLFEGNVIGSIYYGDYWGPTGPLTTTFRNRTYSIWAKDYSEKVSIIGNTVHSQKCGVDSSCLDSYVNGNRIQGKFTFLPDQQIQLPPSLYLTSKPDFWGTQPWPCIGADVDSQEEENMIKIPAQERFEELNK